MIKGGEVPPAGGFERESESVKEILQAWKASIAVWMSRARLAWLLLGLLFACDAGGHAARPRE